MVTVDTAQEYEISLSTKVTIAKDSNLNNIEQQITNQVNNYLLELRKAWESDGPIVIRISQIEARILNIESVLDISNTNINSNTGNIQLETMEIPVLKEVDIS